MEHHVPSGSKEVLLQGPGQEGRRRRAHGRGAGYSCRIRGIFIPFTQDTELGVEVCRVYLPSKYLGYMMAARPFHNPGAKLPRV